MSLQQEQQFISAVLDGGPDAYAEVVTGGVRDGMFATHGPLWQAIGKYYNLYGALPTYNVVGEWAEGQDFETTEHGEPAYELDQLHTNYLARVVRGVLTSNADKITADPRTVIDNVVAELSALSLERAKGVSYLDTDGEQYVNTLAEAREHVESGDDFIGLRTGIEPIDIQRVGWRPATLSVVIGAPGSGKSELLILSAVQAWMDGARVVFVSTELTKDVVISRAQVIHMHKLGLAEYPGQSQIDTGKVDEQEFLAFEDYALSTAHDERFMILDQTRGEQYTVPQIKQFALNHKADLIIIDGFKYLKSGLPEAESEYRHHKYLFDNVLQLARVDGFTILAAEHTKAAVKANEEPKPDSSYMGRHPEQGAERVLGLWKSTQQADRRFLTSRKHRSGVEITKRKEISYDVEHGDVGRWTDTNPMKASSELGQFVGQPLEVNGNGHSAL